MLNEEPRETMFLIQFFLKSIEYNTYAIHFRIQTT